MVLIDAGAKLLVRVLLNAPVVALTVPPDWLVAVLALPAEPVTLIPQVPDALVPSVHATSLNVENAVADP